MSCPSKTQNSWLSLPAVSTGLPSMHGFREEVEAGGLISYGPNLTQPFRHAAAFVDKILKGVKPADLPVQQPTKFELVINLKTVDCARDDNWDPGGSLVCCHSGGGVDRYNDVG